MARRRRYRRRNTRGKFAFVYRLLIFVIICGAIAAALALFFKVDRVEVSGNSRYSTEEIVEAGGVAIGENLFFLNKYEVASCIAGDLTYVESVQISRRLPNTLCIAVSECEHAVAVEQDGALWLGCYNGKIADTAPIKDKANYVMLTGLTLQEPTVGQSMIPLAEQESKYHALLLLLRQLYQKNMLSDLQEIHLEEDAYLSLRYLGRFDVQLLWTADFDYKLEYLKAVVERLEDNEKGTIDLTQDGKASFVPK
ncbi:MAG: FtsQ-type POTRA domain-containing protein [Eubacteriales bacterium]|nr:FtsQ-type POTRA domain-containing protein [Eubacteriales bacterium]